MTTRKFNGKIYKAYGEYYGKKQAEKYAKKLRAKGYYVRRVKGSFIGSYTLYVRKKRKKIR